MNFLQEAKAFSKAQLSAFIGGLVDYAVMIGCHEILGLHYVLGIAAGGIIGAIVNFTINKYWTFKGRPEKGEKQIGKFVTVVCGSIFLKSAGTLFFTEMIRIDYRISRLITDIIVSFGFNYTLQRFWVFRKQMSE